MTADSTIAWRERIERPLWLPPNPVYRAYIGGDRLRRFQGLAGRGNDNWPEEWVGSITAAGNPDPKGQAQGLSVVESGVSLGSPWRASWMPIPS